MPYLVRKKIKGKEYFYLVYSVNVGGWVKKFQRYLGPKKPSEREFRKHGALLKRRVEEFRLKTDPLLWLISRAELEELESIRKAYKKLSGQSPSVKENYYQWFVAAYTYNSNAIEGSTLTLRETAMLLFEDMSPAGRPLRDVLAAENHKKAFDWLLLYKGELSKRLVLRLHKILTAGILSSPESGKFRKVQVYVRGAEEIPPKPKDVEPQISTLLRWHKVNKRRYHPVILASYFHVAFEGIHPFVDFNGRAGRLLLNFILLKNGYPPIDIKNNEKLRYYNAIRSGIADNIKPFVRLVIKNLKDIGKKLE